jgi:hypothetical protein
MTFDELLSKYSSGFALDRLHEVRLDGSGIKTGKTERKLLTSLIEYARARGRVGRVLNLLVIGLVTETDYWFQWIRRSSILRPSAYDLDTAVPKKLLRGLREVSNQFSFPPSFVTFLDSVEDLFLLARVAHETRVRLIRLLGQDRLLIKSCLVTVDLLFIGRTEMATGKEVRLSPENAAAALSYLVYLVRKKFGVTFIQLTGVDTGKINSGYYLAILEETWKVCSYFSWEILVFHFDYSCSVSGRTFHIMSPNSGLAKSIRAGFIRQEMQNLALVSKIPDNVQSLTEVAAKFGEFMENHQLIRRVNDPQRWLFFIPVVPILTEYFSSNKLFREELGGLYILCYDLLSTIEEVTSFEVDQVKIGNLIKAQRLMYVIHRVRVEKLKQNWSTDRDVAIQSVAAVYDDDSLINFLSYSLPVDNARKILGLLEWKPAEKSYFDIMYQPVLRAAGGKILIAPNLFSTSNLPRNVMQLKQRRIGEKGDGLLAQRLTKELQQQGFNAWADIKYRYGGIEGDCDVVALKDGYLFIFECKNSLHPCSNAELRTSFDCVMKAQSQLERFASLWSDIGFREYFAKRLATGLSAVQNTATAIITGNRMFAGWQVGQNKILGFHELVSFVREAKVIIFDHEIVGRDEGLLSAKQLHDFVTSAPWEQRLLSAMKRSDRVTSFGVLDVHVEDYSLKMVDYAKEWGIEPPPELRDTKELR